MALKEQDIVFHTKDSNGNTVLQLPVTRVENVEGAIKTVNGNSPDANGNISPSQTGCLPLAGGNMTGTIAARHSIDDATTVPSSNQYQTALTLKDKNNQAFGHIQTASYADTGKLLVKMSVVDGLRNGNLYEETPATHFIGIGMDASGTPYTLAPNPPAGDDSDQIATTAWVRNTFDSMIDDEGVVHIANAETITGAKTFSAVSTFNGTVNLNSSVIGGAERDIWFAHVAGATSNRSVILSGNAYADGASFYLNAKDYSTNGGAFQINAHDGATVKTLLGKPDGTLTWGGKNVTLQGDCLPVKGGTLSGDVCFSSNGGYIHASSTSLSLSEGHADNGASACVALFRDGHILLAPRNTSQESYIDFYPDGRVEINDKRVFNEIAGKTWGTGKTWTLPSYGSWSGMYFDSDSSGDHGAPHYFSGTAGGTTLTVSGSHITGFAIRVA